MPALLPLIVVVPLVAALLSLALGRFIGRHTGLLMAGAALVCFALALDIYASATAGAPIYQLAWIPALNINLRFRGDPFGLFFALVIAGIGALVACYSVSYPFKLPGARLGRYYASLTAFMASMLGIALADDLILLFVFWEITSVTSFLLIGFWYEYDSGREGALTALQVTALGGLAMMVGFVMVGMTTETFTISDLAGDPILRERLTASPLLLPAFILILAGILTKSAQVPFHFWLPAAMVAPTPVSTYLHAAAMVKAGIFLAGRMLPVFGETPYWSPVLVSCGLATFWLGAYQAFRETDLKAMLARSTFSTLGLILMVYGLKAADQDSVQILSHALYKGALFLVVGIVEHTAHTRDLRKLGGLRRQLPATFGVALLAALSMAGVAPLFGFLAKEALYTELLESPMLAADAIRWGVIGAVVTANALIFGVAMKLVIGIFLGERSDESETSAAGRDSAGLWLPPAILAAAALIAGGLSASPVVGQLMSGFSSDPDAHLHLSLWPGHGGALGLSLVTFLLGVIIYRARATIEQWQRAIAALPSAQRGWEAALEAVGSFASWYSSRWQNGSLRWYFSATLLFCCGLFAFAIEQTEISSDRVPLVLGNLTWHGAVLCALIAAASVLVVRATTRLAAAISLTAVGFLVALMYVIYRSPDIVLTQILIETVSTIFILLVLFFMPVFRRDGLSPGESAWNVMVAGATGLLMFALVLLCTSPGLRETDNLARTYLERSLAEGGGSNAVNVIIVDIRAMDTTGEITVLVVVGLCIYGVLRARRARA